MYRAENAFRSELGLAEGSGVCDRGWLELVSKASGARGADKTQLQLSLREGSASFERISLLVGYASAAERSAKFDFRSRVAGTVYTDRQVAA